MTKIALALMFLLVSTSAYATRTVGLITHVWTHNNSNHFLFELDADADRPLSCRDNAFRGFGGRGRYVVDVTTPTGKAIMSQVLTAKATKALVTVEGEDHCNDWGDSETVRWISHN